MAKVFYLTTIPEQGIMPDDLSQKVASFWQSTEFSVQFLCHQSNFYKLAAKNGLAALKISNVNNLANIRGVWVSFYPTWLFKLANLFSEDIYFVINVDWYNQSKAIFDPLIDTISANIGKENNDIVALITLGIYKPNDPGTGGGSPSAGAKIP